jgi:transcriptional regulator with XRE-family HTH domain
MGNAAFEVIDAGRLVKMRRARGKSRREIALAAEMSYGYLRYLEKGDYKRLSEQRATRLADALGVDRSEIFKVVA